METLKERIKRHEGFRARAYADTLGKMTIGYGRCLTTNGISEDEAEYMLNNDIEESQFALAQSFPWTLGLDDARKDVLAEMIFQLGVKGVMGFPKMIAAIRIGDFDSAAKEMLNSTWHIQTHARCEELSNIMLTGGNNV